MAFMSTSVSARRAYAGPRKGIEIAIAACAGAFVILLAISAYWDPTIRVVHLFEALPFVLAAVLCFRAVKLGYALGFASGAFWLWSAGTLTTFVHNGFQRLAILVKTGTVERGDILIAAPAAIATGGLALFSLWGYACLKRRNRSDLGLFAGALLAVAAWSLAIFAVFAPRYLQMFKPLLP